MLAANIPASKTNYKTYLDFNNSVLPDFEVTDKEFETAYFSLKRNKSAGYDEISANVIINSFKNISTPLKHIFNASLTQGVFPDKLKIAKITPIFKAGEKNEVSNYRPISVLPCFSKILERIMYNRLYNFLRENNILYEKQFGFQNSHSTDHAIIQLIDEISKSFEKNEYTLGVFIDLSKAFDTVDHQILLGKLSNYGIRNTNYKWFKSYLTNRNQFVPYDQKKKLKWQLLNVGYPKGLYLDHYYS